MYIDPPFQYGRASLVHRYRIQSMTKNHDGNENVYDKRAIRFFERKVIGIWGAGLKIYLQCASTKRLYLLHELLF